MGGSTVSGAHGVGVEKLNSMCMELTPEENEQLLGGKRAFDPAGLHNPREVIAISQRCAEYGKQVFRSGAGAAFGSAALLKE